MGNEALLGRCSNAHNAGGTFQGAGPFEIHVKTGDSQSRNHQRQRQEVKHAAVLLPGKKTNSQNRDNAHDECALVEAQRTSFECHANAQPQAPRQCHRCNK